MSKMMKWVNSTPERRQSYAQECLMVDTTEAIYAAMERRKMSSTELAIALKTSKSNISQILSGKRNLTLRTLSDIVHALDCKVTVRVRGIAKTRPVAGREKPKGEPAQPSSIPLTDRLSVSNNRRD